MSYDLEDEHSDGSGGANPGTEERGITDVGPHDVLMGRGGGTNNHEGNIKFRSLVNEHKLRYLAASKVDKPKVAREVVQVWRSLTPPGRFLARKNDGKKGPGSVKAEGNVWYDVGDKKAREKASQCLRERTPDVIPFVKELQRQQDFITGHGLKFVEQQMREQKAGREPSPMPPVASTPAQAISEPDVANAFSLDHFHSQGGFHHQATPPRFDGEHHGSNPNTPSSHYQMDPLLNQISPEEMNQWFEQNELDPAPLPTDATDFDAHQRMPMPDMQGSNLFDSALENTEDEMTLEEYQKSLEEYLRSNNLSPQTKKKTKGSKKGKSSTSLSSSSSGGGAPPIDALEDMRQNSWVKSFHSIETKESDKLMMTPVAPKKRSALENTIQRSQMAALASQGRSTRTNLTTGTEMSTKSALSAMSGISLFSDMSEESRATKMSMAQHFTSNLSMMSEMTDLSETLNSMDLNAHPHS